MTPKKQASGGSRLVASGKKPILLGVTAADHKLLAQAALREGLPITQFLLKHGLAAARRTSAKKI